MKIGLAAIKISSLAFLIGLASQILAGCVRVDGPGPSYDAAFLRLAPLQLDELTAPIAL